MMPYEQRPPLCPVVENGSGPVLGLVFCPLRTEQQLLWEIRTPCVIWHLTVPYLQGRGDELARWHPQSARKHTESVMNRWAATASAYC